MYNHGHGPIKAFQYSLGLPQLKWIFETPSLFSNGISLLRVSHLNVEFELHCWTAILGIMYILQNRVYPRTKSSIVLDLNWHGELTTVTLDSSGASSRVGRAAARATPLMSSMYITFDVENISWLLKTLVLARASRYLWHRHWHWLSEHWTYMGPTYQQPTHLSLLSPSFGFHTDLAGLTIVNSSCQPKVNLILSYLDILGYWFYKLKRHIIYALRFNNVTQT